MDVSIAVYHQQAVLSRGQEDHIILKAAELHPSRQSNALRAAGQVAHAGVAHCAQVGVLSAAPQLQGVADLAWHQSGPPNQTDIQSGVNYLGEVKRFLERYDDVLWLTWNDAR